MRARDSSEGRTTMNLRRGGIALCTIALWLLLAAFTQLAAAQTWVASTGSVDEGGISQYLFTNGVAFVDSSVNTGTLILRYNVLPVGDLAVKLTNPCCEGRSLLVRFLDNGSGAQVLV